MVWFSYFRVLFVLLICFIRLVRVTFVFFEMMIVFFFQNEAKLIDFLYLGMNLRVSYVFFLMMTFWSNLLFKIHYLYMLHTYIRGYLFFSCWFVCFIFRMEEKENKHKMEDVDGRWFSLRLGMMKISVNVFLKWLKTISIF